MSSEQPGVEQRHLRSIEEHTESSLERVVNKTSKSVPSKAQFSIEPGTGPEIQGLLHTTVCYCFQ